MKDEETDFGIVLVSTVGGLFGATLLFAVLLGILWAVSHLVIWIDGNHIEALLFWVGLVGTLIGPLVGLLGLVLGYNISKHILMRKLPPQ